MCKNKEPVNPYAFANENQSGMTLRDYFASVIINVILKYHYDNPMERITIDAATQKSYELADAMLKAREL